MVLKDENQECLKQVKEIYFELDFFSIYHIVQTASSNDNIFARNENIGKIRKRTIT